MNPQQSTDTSSLEEVLRDGDSEPSENMSFGAAANPQTPALSMPSSGTASRPLLGRLPLARVIPQDVHSVMDYAAAGMVLAGTFSSDCAKARAASSIIGGSGLAVSSLTDYRLSVDKLIPIETHEVIDYAFGVSAIAAPFLLGYHRSAPWVAAAHVIAGAATLLTALFTDYRAYSGVGRR